MVVRNIRGNFGLSLPQKGKWGEGDFLPYCNNPENYPYTLKTQKEYRILPNQMALIGEITQEELDQLNAIEYKRFLIELTG